MSHIYHNWEKLVDAVVKREQYRKLCYSESLRSSFGSDSSDSSAASCSSRRFSFDVSSSGQAPQDGNSQSYTATSSANARLFSHVPKPTKMIYSSPFDKIFGAARRFVTPVRKHLQSNAPVIQSGYSAPTAIEVMGDIPDACVLSFNELKEQTDNFGASAIIAEGFNGKVYFARLDSGKDAALKILDATSELDSNDEFLRKVSTVSRFKHENVVELLGYCIENDHRILAYEFETMGTLHSVLHGEQSGTVLNWMQRVRIAVDAARGLEYLHENGAIHKDIRSSNVLLFNDFKAKISDINLSTKDFDDYLNPDPLYYATTPRHPGFEYHAPELALIDHLTLKSDVYSFGVVLLELLTGRKSLDNALPRGQQILVTWAMPQLTKNKVKGCVDPKLMGEYPPNAAAKLAGVAALCLQYEAEHRPDMRAVVKALQPLLKAPATGI